MDGSPVGGSPVGGSPVGGSPVGGSGLRREVRLADAPSATRAAPVDGGPPRDLWISSQVRGLCSNTHDVIIEHMFESDGTCAKVAGPAAAMLARLEDAVAVASALRDRARGAETWSSSERRRALRLLDGITAQVAVARSALLVAEQASAVGAGDRDAIAARGRSARIGLGEARREARQAQTLAALPAMAEAVATGLVPLPHVDALARVTETSSERAAATLRRPEVARRLVGLAQQLTVTEFASSAARLLAAADPEALERSVDAQRRGRFFVMSHQADGTYLRGRVDRLAGEALRVALAAVREAPDEQRDAAQANADALVALAERALAGTAGIRARRVDDAGRAVREVDQEVADARVSGVAQRPQVAVLVPAATFAELRAAQVRRRSAAGEPAAGPAEAVPAALEPAALESGAPVAMSQLARLLCDAEVSRVVMSAPSQPLDVGRSHRVYTAAQRRAVIVRDRACAWNGCDVPAAFCEVHHIRWWDRDRGPTDLENGVLLCSHHHHTVHRLDLAIERLGVPPGGEPVAGGVLGEPVRYEFTFGSGPRVGQTVNAPPRAGATPLGSVA